MTPIQIEQIGRMEALKNCDMCARKLAHLHFYVEGKTKKFKTFEDCLAHTKSEMTDWAETCADGFPQEFHSFNGGKSKSEFLAEDAVRAAAEGVWEKDSYPLAAQTVSCISLDDDHIIELCRDENFKGFIKTCLK
jgi:hypothetical protein